METQGTKTAVLVYDSLVEVGGAERVMATHARYLEKAGFNVTLLFGFVDKKITEYAFLKGLKIESYAKTKVNEPVAILSNIVGRTTIDKYKNVDVVVTYSFIANHMTRHFSGKKVFYYLPVEFVDLPFKERLKWADVPKRKIALAGALVFGPYIRHLAKKYAHAQDVVFVNGKLMRKDAEENYGLKNVITSYPPLNNVFRILAQEEIKPILEKYKLKPPFFFNAGRIIPDKRYDLLFEIMQKVGGQLVIAGQITGEYKRKLQNEIKEKNLNVKLLGLVTQKELVALYNAAELFLFPTPKEAFGLIIIETSACGTPAIVWDDDAGPSETLINGVNGYRAKPYDIDDFVKKIKQAQKTQWDPKKVAQTAEKFSEKTQEKIFLEHM